MVLALVKLAVTAAKAAAPTIQSRAFKTLAQTALLLALIFAGTSVCYASRGGSAGQDVLLGPNGMDTKESAADAVKNDNKQKGGGQKGGGGGGDAGGTGKGQAYPWNNNQEHTSFMGQNSGGGAYVPGISPIFAAGNAPFPGAFSGSGESGPTNDTPGYKGQGTDVYGGYAGSNHPDYSSKSSVPLGQQPMHPQRGPAPEGHPRDAVKAGLPPCCTDKLPCCSSNWPCCRKAEYHGYTAPGSPDKLPYSKNMQGPDNVLKKGDTKQNQEGQNNNNNNNANSSTPSSSTMNGQAQTECMPNGPASNVSMGPAGAADGKAMMGASGMNGKSGGKLASQAGQGVTGIMTMFSQMRGGQTPGANKGQKQTDQLMEKSVEADNLAGMEREQAATAIEFIMGFMQNFTSGGNKYVTLHDTLFVPMAVLLLLPGAVLAQTKSIAAQGFSVLGEISPWEGILRSIVAIFLIMSSGLIINYGIDVANALVKAVSEGYSQNFGSNMGSDAEALHVRAHPIRIPEENFGVIPEDMQAIMFNYFGSSSAASMEGSLLAIKYEDPRAGLYIVPPDRAPEVVPAQVPFAREAFNGINCGMAMTWAIMCCVQECYLYYLYFVGPVIAALWVYPSQMLRQAFPNWIEGVVCVCFWSMFWATTVCLMACFRGVDDTGTVACTALLSLALVSVKSAFDFVGLAKEAGRDAARVAEKVGQALHAAKDAKKKGGGPGPGPGPG